MRKYKILSKFECLIEAQNKSAIIDDFSFIIIEAEKGEVIKVYPITTDKNICSLPFCVKIGEWQNTEHIDLGDFVQIELHPFLISKQQCVVCEKKFNSTKINVSNFPHIVSVEMDKQIYVQNIEGNFETFDIDYNNDFIKIHAKGKEQCAVIFHNKNKIFSVFYGENITFSQKNMTILQNLHNFAKHGRELQFDIDNEKCVLTKSELYYFEKRPQMTKIEKLVPFAFLEAVQVKDYNLAKFYVAEPLKSKLSNKHIEKFFGEFDKIIQIENNTFALVNENSLQGKYQIQLENGLIKNIM